MVAFTFPTVPVVVTEAISFVGILLVTWLIAHFVGRFLGKFFKIGPPIIAVHVKRLTLAIIWLMGILLALAQIGLHLEVFLLLIGLAGVMLAIASREVLENVASKYFADFYIPFKMGDSISIRGFSGKVIEINPISTVLITEDENLISIPNSIFLKEVVVNATPKAWKEVAIPILIDNNIPLPDFESDVLRSCHKVKHLLDERFPPILTVKKRDAKTTELTLTLMIKEPETKDAIISDISARVSEIQERLKKNLVDQKVEP
ncbi:MAG TPA: mechanosensitive ion channel domain-containing protein [Candidatus Acidoferrales bacterium]|nr:mechanosensitive ion channel domain-containing protein [Candidatus Acidoferrales bacterium]